MLHLLNLGQKAHFFLRNWICTSIIENSDFETGTDLTDIYFAKRNNVSENKIEIVLSETEKEIQRLSKINSSIISLNETFDLIDERGNGIIII